VAAVEDLLDRIPVPAHLDLGAPDAVSRTPTHIQSTAYFVIAEGLTNAVKHARATDIEVRMTVRESRLLLDVIDNGIGFDHGEAASNGMGFGLRSVADRVSAIGGLLAVVGPAGGGTHLSAELPCAS
jgi:signal transduction histidine kinase